MSWQSNSIKTYLSFLGNVIGWITFRKVGFCVAVKVVFWDITDPALATRETWLSIKDWELWLRIGFKVPRTIGGWGGYKDGAQDWWETIWAELVIVALVWHCVEEDDKGWFMGNLGGENDTWLPEQPISGKMLLKLKFGTGWGVEEENVWLMIGVVRHEQERGWVGGRGNGLIVKFACWKLRFKKLSLCWCNTGLKEGFAGITADGIVSDILFCGHWIGPGVGRTGLEVDLK